MKTITYNWLIYEVKIMNKDELIKNYQKVFGKNEKDVFFHPAELM